jgi:hypothetical protein
MIRMDVLSNPIELGNYRILNPRVFECTGKPKKIIKQGWSDRKFSSKI